MVVCEINYQEGDHANFQQRFLEVPSWDVYKDFFLGYRDDLMTKIHKPDGFILLDVTDNFLMGRFPHKAFGRVFYIHEAHVCPDNPVVEGYIINR